MQLTTPNNHLHKGFTMIELLIVIMLIGVITSFLGLNWVSIRSRGSDHKKKVEITELQKALQIYQQRFGHFPKRSGFQRLWHNWYRKLPSLPHRRLCRWRRRRL